MKIYNTIFLCAALLLAPVQAMARLVERDSINYASHDSTMNALDFVLQRPEPARTFPAKRFGDHLFLTLEGGPQWMRTSGGLMGIGHGGYRFGATIGDWVTPAHGWRVGFSGGRHWGIDRHRPFFGAVSADYLLNFTSLLKGDSPRRGFEIIGVMGAEFQLLHRGNNKLWGAAGARIGLQPRFYFTPSTYFYIEPRLGIYTDKLDNVRTWHRYDWNAQLMFGFGYRITDRRFRRYVDNSLWVNELFRNNLFAGVSGSILTLGNNTDNIRHRLAPQGNVFVGKWFTPSSGVRVQLGAGAVKENKSPRRWNGMLDIDYVFNLNSAVNGYDPDRATDLNILLGVSGAYISGPGKNFFPGLNASMQGVLNVSRNVGLFVEPQMKVFRRSIMTHPANRMALMPSVSVGVVYRTRATRGYNNAMSVLEDSLFAPARHMFFTFEGGIFQRSRGWNPSMALSAMVGSWFTPVSAWRVGVDAENYQSRPPFRSVSFTADYMASLSSLSGGFDPERIFDLRAFAGMSAGLAYYNRNMHRLVWGPRIGLQAAFRLSDALDLVVEPQAAIVSAPKYRRRFNPEWRAMVGLSYKLGNRHSVDPSSRIIDTDESSRSYLALSVAPGLFSEGLRGKNISFAFNAALGGWFSRLSGVQAYFDYDLAKKTGRNERRINIATIGLDYMFNITALSTGSPSNKFNFIALLGPGVAWSNDGNGAAAALHAGLQSRWTVAPGWELTLTPSLMGWTDGVMKNAPHKLIGSASLQLGAAYSF